MNEPKEIRRERNVMVETACIERVCDRCGDKFELWFNGGELDGHLCKCGRTWELEHQAIDLVVYDHEELT